MSKKGRRVFDHAYKTMVVELYQSGKASVDIGKDLGINADLVRRWSREFKTDGLASFPGNGKQNLSAEQKEILSLKKALKESELEKEILKKAVSIFSRGDSKYTSL